MFPAEQGTIDILANRSAIGYTYLEDTIHITSEILPNSCRIVMLSVLVVRRSTAPATESKDQIIAHGLGDRRFIPAEQLPNTFLKLRWPRNDWSR